MIDGSGISCEIALIWMPLNFIDDHSALVQVMAWCRQATSHYLGQCWPRSLSPYGVTSPQWVNILLTKSHYPYHDNDDDTEDIVWINSNPAGIRYRALCNIGYPYETHPKLNSRQISFVHSIHFNCSNVSKFCTEHNTAFLLPCAMQNLKTIG